MFKLINKLGVFIMLVFLFSSCHAAKTIENTTQTVTQDSIPGFGKIIDKFLESDVNVGVAIATIDNGKVQYYNYGHASKQNKSPINERSIFEIGSITKTFTTTILVEMINEGQLALDDPISKYLPEEVIHWDSALSISVKELASHSSGLPRLPGNLFATTTDMKNPYANYSPEHLYEFLKQYTPTAKEERKPEYSNLGMGILSHILELISGLPYEQLVTKYISTPLEMSKTKITMNEEELKTMVVGYDAEGNETPYWDLPSPLSGAGAIRSNTDDMVKFIEAQMKNKLWQTAHQPIAEMMPNVSTGLAWVVMPLNEETVIWHNGGTGGFTSFCGFIKDSNKAVVVLNNSTSNVDGLGIYVLNSMSQK